MLHSDTEVRLIDERIGHGVFATRLIPKGTAVWVRDKFDRVYTEAEVRNLEPVYQEILEKYCFRDREGHWVFCWDITRFINHSFCPTCIATPYGFEIAVVDVEPGRQITNDYGFFNIIEPFECFPEAGCHRTMVMPDDILRYGEEWDRQLADAFRYFNRVAQPLEHLVEPAVLAKARLVSDGVKNSIPFAVVISIRPRGPQSMMIEFVPLSSNNFSHYEADILRSEEMFPEAIRETSTGYLNVLKSDVSIGLVAQVEQEYAGNVVGFVPCRQERQELLLTEAGAEENGLIYLFNIVTLTDFQGQGVGRLLLSEFLDLAAERGFRRVGGHFRGNGSLANFKRMGGQEFAAFEDWFGTGERYLYCELPLG